MSHTYMYHHPVSFPCSHNMLTMQWTILEKNIGIGDIEFQGVKWQYEKFHIVSPLPGDDLRR